MESLSMSARYLATNTISGNCGSSAHLQRARCCSPERDPGVIAAWDKIVGVAPLCRDARRVRYPARRHSAVTTAAAQCRAPGSAIAAIVKLVLFSRQFMEVLART